MLVMDVGEEWIVYGDMWRSEVVIFIFSEYFLNCRVGLY